jgi:hypothetical protein
MNPFRWYFEHFDWGYKLVRAIGRNTRDSEYREQAERTQQERDCSGRCLRVVVG